MPGKDTFGPSDPEETFMKILVLNCGSSSVKFQLLEMENERLLCRGIVEKIGSANALLRYRPEEKPEIKEVQEVLDHSAAINLAISTMMHSRYGVIKDKSEIAGVGHRTVHGGEKFAGSVLIDDQVLKSIRDCIEFAPLHNPHNLKGIEVCQQLLPEVKQVAVFDTAFHQTMSPTSYVYGLPYALYRKLHIRRYGFHGTSHKYVARRAAEILKKSLKELLIITCHLGNGASAAAVKHGLSIDSSMGFTPLEGLLMGTRCGDIDPALVLYVMERENLAPDEVNAILNKRSGLLGISETSSDFREVLEEAEAGSAQHQLAIDLFCQRVKKYIGAYAAELGGLDAVVFTGGIGENAPVVRQKSCQGLEFLGIAISRKKNETNQSIISSGRVKVLVIPTNEELAIARDTKRILLSERRKKETLEDTVAAELASLTRDDRLEVFRIWAVDTKMDMLTLSKTLSKRIGKVISSQALQHELLRLGLIEESEK
jgi:acetate kinase